MLRMLREQISASFLRGYLLISFPNVVGLKARDFCLGSPYKISAAEIPCPRKF